MANQSGLRRVLLWFRHVASHENPAKESLDCHGLVGITSLDVCDRYVLQQLQLMRRSIRPDLSKVGSTKGRCLR